MKEDRYISICVDYTQVEGLIVSAERKVVTVEITSPFGGISGDTVLIPEDFTLTKGYLDKRGYLTDRGREAAKRVLEEIYRGRLFVEEKKDNLLLLYESYKREQQLTHEGEGEIGEQLLYALFTYTITTYHRKISYDIFRQLVKKFVLES